MSPEAGRHHPRDLGPGKSHRADQLVDYNALIKTTPPARRHTLPSPPAASYTPPPAAPHTVLTMSADLERDSRGNEHLHARVRDHTGVQKVVNKKLSPKVKGHRSLSPKGKL